MSPLFKHFYLQCAEGHLDEVKKLVESNVVDINYKTEINELSAIEIAAQNGHLNVVEYLFTRCTIAASDKNPGLLYNICVCEETEERHALLNWLLMDERYKALGDGISEAHINAALGYPFATPQSTAYSGLYPLHYACFVDNEHIVQCDAQDLNQSIEQGYFKGATPFYLLYYNKSDLIKPLALKGLRPNTLNTCPTSEYNFLNGITLAFLLSVRKDFDVLQELATQIDDPINLDATPCFESSPRKGETLSYVLARNNQFDLLTQFATKSKKTPLLNKAITSTNHPMKGATLPWILAYKKQWDLLLEFANNSDEIIDLDTVIENGRDEGITLAWLLASGGILTELYKKYGKTPNLNAAPMNENHLARGITLASLLASTPLLEEMAACSDKPVSLNARGNSKATLLRELLCREQWSTIRTIINGYQQHPNCVELIADVTDNHLDYGADFIYLILAEQYQQGIRKLLINKQELEDKFNEMLAEQMSIFLSYIHSILPASSWYQQAQSMKGHVLLELAKAIELDKNIDLNWYSRELEQNRSFHSLNTSNIIHTVALESLMKGQEFALVMQLFAEEKAKNELLEKKNKTLKLALESKSTVDFLATSNSTLQFFGEQPSLTNKKRKLETNGADEISTKKQKFDNYNDKNPDEEEDHLAFGL